MCVVNAQAKYLRVLACVCVCAPAPVFVCECMGDGHRQHVCVCAGIHDTFCLFTVVLQAATGGPRGNQASLMPLISDLSGMVCVVGVGVGGVGVEQRDRGGRSRP